MSFLMKTDITFNIIIKSGLNLAVRFYKISFLRCQLINANQGRDHVQIRLDVSYISLIL